MKVCIDAQPFVSKRTGVGRYTYALIEAFSREKLDMDISVFYFNARRNFKDDAIFGNNPRLIKKEIRWMPGFVAHTFWNAFPFPPVELLAGRHDLFHFMNFTSLPVRKGKTLLTVCDATIKRFPETMEQVNRLRLEKHLERSMHQSSGIIAISEFTKQEIVRFYQYPEDKVFVTHLGIGESFREITDASLLEQTKKRYQINRPYILFTGTLEPRKNIPLLIRAFNVLAKDSDHQLVIVGRKGWSYEGIVKEIEDSPCKDRILHPGYVDENDLSFLYSGAELFVFPSLYEGFGFPPLEAMRCGTPVLSSDKASLKEVLRDGAQYFDPLNTGAEDLADMMKDILNDKEKMDILSEKGKKVALSYTWEKTAKETLKVYKAVMGSA